MKSQITEKVLDHVVCKEVDRIYKDVIKTVYVCDICGSKTNAATTCLGCNRDFCFTCADHYHDSDVMTHSEFGVGTPEDCWDGGYEPASEDYRIIHLHLCKSCKENPPEKIRILIGHIKDLRAHKRLAYKTEDMIIDEIKTLEK